MFGIGSLFSAGGPMVSQIINGMKDQQLGPIAGLAAQAGLQKKPSTTATGPKPQVAGGAAPSMDIPFSSAGAVTGDRQVPGIQGLTINTGNGPIGNPNDSGLGGGINTAAIRNAMAPSTVAASQPGQQAMENLTDMTERKDRLKKVSDALTSAAKTYQETMPKEEEKAPPAPVMPSMGQNVYGGSGIGRLPEMRGGGIGRLPRFGLGNGIQM